MKTGEYESIFFVSFFSCHLQDFKVWYVNGKAFGASFLYWVYFKKQTLLLSTFFFYFFQSQNQFRLQTFFDKILIYERNFDEWTRKMIIYFSFAFIGTWFESRTYSWSEQGKMSGRTLSLWYNTWGYWIHWILQFGRM